MSVANYRRGVWGCGAHNEEVSFSAVQPLFSAVQPLSVRRRPVPKSAAYPPKQTLTEGVLHRGSSSEGFRAAASCHPLSLLAFISKLATVYPSYFCVGAPN